jgi:hypothetical protein
MKNHEIDQPPNETNAQPVIVVASMSTNSNQCTPKDVRCCQGGREASGARCVSRPKNHMVIRARITIPIEIWNVIAFPGFMSLWMFGTSRLHIVRGGARRPSSGILELSFHTEAALS